MTETEWLESTDPKAMLDLADGRTRKLRLFACACCRRVFNEFAPPLAVRAATAAEMAADGEIPDKVLVEQIYPRVRDASVELAEATPRVGPHYANDLMRAAMFACAAPAPSMARATALACALAVADIPLTFPRDCLRPPLVPPEFDEERAAQADLLRDILGNPFRSSELRPEWLTDTVVGLARQMYASREFSGMPILADALQDAGCDDEDMLSHCREEREHVRGCWVVDLLLGLS